MELIKSGLSIKTRLSIHTTHTPFNTLQIISTGSITQANTIKDHVTPTQCGSTLNPFTGKYLVL